LTQVAFRSRGGRGNVCFVGHIRAPLGAPVNPGNGDDEHYSRSQAPAEHNPHALPLDGNVFGAKFLTQAHFHAGRRFSSGNFPAKRAQIRAQRQPILMQRGTMGTFAQVLARGQLELAIFCGSA
jgi:hypothetical protein